MNSNDCSRKKTRQNNSFFGGKLQKLLRQRAIWKFAAEDASEIREMSDSPLEDLYIEEKSGGESEELMNGIINDI